MSDVLIVGGGVIGLSIARELAEQDLQVQVIDRQATGQEASWAGAGMIPPGEIHLQNEQYQRLALLSSQLWPEFAENLINSTGVDLQYLVCGALIYSSGPGGDDSLAKEVISWQQQGSRVEMLDANALRALEPAVAANQLQAYHLPEQAQVRNPRYLQGLKRACENLGVEILTGEEVVHLHFAGDALTFVETPSRKYSAEKFLWATGSWSNQFSGPLQWSVPVEPVRGQIALFQTSGTLKKIVEQGKRYLVPRQDGKLLVGSTEERVAFDRQPSQARIQELQEFGSRFFAELELLSPERNWCGFRPMSPDQLPVLGRLPNWENVYVATGHYRAGLSLSPVTAVLMRQLLLNQPLDLPIDDFSPERFRSSSAPTVW